MHFCDDNIIWKLSDFISRQTIGIAGRISYTTFLYGIYYCSSTIYSNTDSARPCQTLPVRDDCMRGVITSVERRKLCFDLRYVCWFVSLSLSVSLSLCMYLCLSASLSVSNITEKRMNGFSWNFQNRWQLIQGTFCNILGIFHLMSLTVLLLLLLLLLLFGGFWGSFLVIWGASVSVANITVKRVNGFSWIFQADRIWNNKQSETFWAYCMLPFESKIDFSIFWIRAW